VSTAGRWFDLAVCTIRVERQLTEMPGGGYAYGAPKSDASIRTVSRVPGQP